MYKQVEVLIHRVSSDSPPLTHSYNKGRLGKGAVLSQCFVTPRFSAQSQVPVSPALHPQTHARSLSGDLQLPECASTRRSRAARRHPGGGASSLAPHTRDSPPAGCVAHRSPTSLTTHQAGDHATSVIADSVSDTICTMYRAVSTGGCSSVWFVPLRPGETNAVRGTYAVWLGSFSSAAISPPF